MYRLGVVLFSLAFLGCMAQKVSYPGPGLADEQINHFAEEMEKEKTLFLVGSGGRMMNCISEFDLHFISNSNQQVSISQVRVLVVEMMERFKKEVNANEKIRPYLSNYPVSNKNIVIRISFYEKFPNRRVPKSSVALVWQRNNKLYYEFYDNETGDFIGKGFNETYEEALRLAHQENVILKPN